MTSVIRCDFCKNTIPPSNVSSLSYLPCLHLICANCKVSRFRAQTLISCAVCNTEFDPGHILELPDPNSLLGVCQSGLCNIKSGIPLKYLCQVCGKYLCEQCGPIHHGTLGHGMKEVEPSLPTYARCPRHPNVRVTFACSCGARCCDECAQNPLHASEGHRTIPFRYLADGARKEIHKLKATTQQDISRFDKSLPLIEKNKTVLSDYASKMRTAVANEVIELCNAVIRRGNDIVTAIDMAEDSKVKQYNQLEHEIRVQRDRFMKLEQLADLFIRAPEPITTVNACNFLQKAFGVVGAKRESTQANYEKIQRHPFMKYESDAEPLLKALANYGQIELDGVKKTPLAFTNPNAKIFSMANNQMMPSTSVARAPSAPRLRYPINAMHMNQPAGYGNQVPNGPSGSNSPNQSIQQRGVVSQGMMDMRQNHAGPPTVSMQQVPPRPPIHPMRLPFQYGMQDPAMMAAGSMGSPTGLHPMQQQQLHSPHAPHSPIRPNFPAHQIPPDFQQMRPGFPMSPNMVNAQVNQQMAHIQRTQSNTPQPSTTPRPATPQQPSTPQPLNLATNSTSNGMASAVQNNHQAPQNVTTSTNTQQQTSQPQNTNVTTAPNPPKPTSDIPLVKLIRDNTGALKSSLQPRSSETASNASTSSEKSNATSLTDRRPSANGTSDKEKRRYSSSHEMSPSKSLHKKNEERSQNNNTDYDSRGKPVNPDDWDDYCYVCNQGCDDATGELGCCSTCPRVFHNKCHIPIIEAAMAELPDDWQCSVCLEASPMTAMPTIFTDHEQLICCKVILHCCLDNQQVEPFLYPVPKNTFKYYEIIKQPMDFGKIRKKLSNFKYQNVGEFIQDMNLVFMNCSRYNTPKNPIALAGKSVYSLYIDAVKKFMPCMQKHVWIYVCLHQDSTKTLTAKIRASFEATLDRRYRRDLEKMQQIRTRQKNQLVHRKK